MEVTHIFEGVSNGENYSTAGPDSAKGFGKALAMNKRDPDTADTDENDSYFPGILVEPEPEDREAYPADPAAGAELPSACVPVTAVDRLDACDLYPLAMHEVGHALGFSTC